MYHLYTFEPLPRTKNGLCSQFLWLFSIWLAYTCFCSLLPKYLLSISTLDNKVQATQPTCYSPTCVPTFQNVFWGGNDSSAIWKSISEYKHESYYSSERHCIKQDWGDFQDERNWKSIWGWKADVKFNSKNYLCH